MFNLMMNNEETHTCEQDDLVGQVNYTLNNFNLKKEKKSLKQFQQQQLKPKSSSSSYSLSSSASSSTSSSYYSPSSYANRYEDNAPFYAQTANSVATAYQNQENHMHRSTSAQSAQEFLYNLSLWKNQLNKTNNLINTQQRQASLNDLTNASLTCSSISNTNINTNTNDESSTASSVNSAVATAAAVAATAAAAAAAAANHHQLQYNPQYLLINLIQNNPTMAFQAAITNRLLNLSNQSQYQLQQQQQQQQQLNTNVSTSTATIKRKTHLSKCFMNDLNQNTDDSLLLNNRSSLTSSPSASSTSSALSSPTSSNSGTSRRSSTASSSSDVQNNYFNSQHYQYEEQNLLNNGKPKSTVRKINFGDISDLIN